MVLLSPPTVFPRPCGDNASLWTELFPFFARFNVKLELLSKAHVRAYQLKLKSGYPDRRENQDASKLAAVSHLCHFHLPWSWSSNRAVSILVSWESEVLVHFCHRTERYGPLR